MDEDTDDFQLLSPLLVLCAADAPDSPQVHVTFRRRRSVSASWHCARMLDVAHLFFFFFSPLSAGGSALCVKALRTTQNGEGKKKVGGEPQVLSEIFILWL